MDRLGLFILVLTTISGKYVCQDIQFISEVQKVMTLENEDFEITCSFQALKDEKPQLFWLNKSDLFGQNDKLFTPDNRTVIKKDFVDDRDSIQLFRLTVKQATLYDEGTYDCQLPTTKPRLSQTHYVTVNVPPKITVEGEQALLEVSLGDKVNLSCPTTGKPEPTVSWVNLDAPELQFPDAEVLTIERIGRDDSGPYRCTASNGYGSDVSVDFPVLVTFPPDVWFQESLISTGPGRDIELKCRAEGSPEVEIIWAHNGKDIILDNRDNVEGLRQDISPYEYIFTLHIWDLKIEDLGSYRCTGGNTKGIDSAEVHVSAMPVDLQIMSSAESPFSEEYILQWQVTSVPQPIEYVLQLSQYNGSEEISLKELIISAEPSDGASIHQQTHLLEGLEKNSTHSVFLTCRSAFGNVTIAQPFFFRTAEVENHPIGVMLGGNPSFGIYGSQHAGSFSSAVTPASTSSRFLITILLILACTVHSFPSLSNVCL